MTLTAEKAAITLRGPATLIASTPHLIGFMPKDSVVAVWLKDGTILVTQRADLKPCLDDPHGFFAPMRKHQPDEVILMFWDADTSDFDGMVSFTEYAKADVTVRDSLWVKGDRWGSLECADSECCPPSGRPIDWNEGDEVAGVSPEPVSHRETLIDECKPAGTEHMKPLDPHGIEGWRDKAIDRVIRMWLDRDDYADKTLVKVGRSLHDIRVRDSILWMTADLTPEEKREAYHLISKVCRLMHPLDAAPALSVAAILAWTSGDGARGNIACDFALRCDSDYSLAQLVSVSLAAGLPPQAWIESMSALTFDDVRVPAKGQSA